MAEASTLEYTTTSPNSLVANTEPVFRPELVCRFEPLLLSSRLEPMLLVVPH